MATTQSWPTYPTGPRESIFAMGVVSIKFAEIESVIVFMFATVLGIGFEAATKIASKIGTGNCQHLIGQLLSGNQWDERTNELVAHFIKGAAILTESRNSLMHSNLAWHTSEHTVLFKTSKQGNTMMSVPKLGELRRVADDMEAFILFGRHLGNAINNVSSGTPIFPAFPWPAKPAMPVPLEFSSEPVTLHEDDK
jgi:hypothetical protein